MVIAAAVPAAWLLGIVTFVSSTKAGGAVRDAARRFGVASLWPLLIMWRESRGNPPKTAGPAGEIGIMQVTPPAMEQTGYVIGLNSTLFEQAVSGVAYWTWLRLTFSRQSVFWCIRAYNVGPGGALAGRGYGYLWRVLTGT